jgi:hypothetical protein
MTRLRRTENGVIVVTDPGADRPVLEVATVQCGHCGGHWAPAPGSGRVRGFCQSCCRPVCGPGCAACVPVEVYLENIEKGRPDDYRPVVVPAGG